MNKRKLILILGSVFLYASLNIFFHLMGFWTYLLLYIAVVNGAVAGSISGCFLNKIFGKRDIKLKSLYVGLAVGIFLALFWMNNQISIEFYINKNKLDLQPPYIDYLRFYLIGLGIGIIKSLYYAIVPCVLIFAGIGIFLEKIFRRGRKE
jgi:hypothetical protein